MSLQKDLSWPDHIGYHIFALPYHVSAWPPEIHFWDVRHHECRLGEERDSEKYISMISYVAHCCIKSREISQKINLLVFQLLLGDQTDWVQLD